MSLVTQEQDATDDVALSDERLIGRFLATGDADAFRALYRRHAPAVYGLLCRLTGGRDGDAADLLQETWIRAAGRLETFGGRARFRTWVSGVAVNCYREWRRREASGAVLTPLESPHGIPDEPRRALALDINQVLLAIPIHYREALLLHDVEGFTHDDIATALGIEPGTSKSRVARARTIFRSLWGQRGDR